MQQVIHSDTSLRDRLLVSTDEVAQLCGMSRSFFYAQLSAGQIGPQPLEFGKRRLFRTADIVSWVAANCPTRERWIEMQENRT